MRTIDNIEAEYNKVKNMLPEGTTNTDLCELELELRQALIRDIPLDRLQEICEAEKDGRCVVLPCKVGDMLYTNFSMQGWYLKSKNRQYTVKVVFVGINDSKEMGYGFMNVKYEKDFMFPVNFSDIGKTVFLTREEAEQALKGGGE